MKGIISEKQKKKSKVSCRRKAMSALFLLSLFLFCFCLGQELQVPVRAEEQTDSGSLPYIPELTSEVEAVRASDTEGEARTSSEGNHASQLDKQPAQTKAKRQIIYYNDGRRPEDQETHTVTIGAVGEVLMHSSVLNGGFDAEGNSDYDYMFRYLAPELAKLDYSICDMEGTLAGPPYTGYPLFSAPDTVAKAIHSAGFDMAVTSNNHMMDRGEEGFLRTIQVLQDHGVETVGGRLTDEEPTFVLKKINGIVVGISAFSYETVRLGEHRAINGIPIPKSIEPRIDTFSQEPEYISQDQERIKERVRQMREAGAELVVFCMHWGTEYLESEDDFSQIYSQTLADAGCDLALNCGPHVVWPVRMISSQDGSHQMLCFYSVGNIVSDQYYSIGDSNGRCEDGILAVARYEKAPGQAVKLVEAGYIATYCKKENIGYDMNLNSVTPVEAALQDPAAYEAENFTNEIGASKERTNVLMEQNTLNGFELKNYVHLPDSWKKTTDVQNYNEEERPIVLPLPTETNQNGEEIIGPALPKE